MKYFLLAALFVGFNLSPGTATHAEDTMPSSGNIVQKEAGLVTIPSRHSVDETVDRLKDILQSKQITLFALIDHSGETAKVGMKMPPTKLLIFGSPKASPSTCHSRFWFQRTPKERSGCRTTVRTT